ncbi:protein STPG4-like isoform X2 [Physella acuta]|uniref:protein STPG4-like isoform X2 n=1 Tax=Physella acuta TaxID=109671 RepID=UPI0027DBD422|nr:protein STPG4-like isoform X2 [Physella acuta]
MECNLASASKSRSRVGLKLNKPSLATCPETTKSKSSKITLKISCSQYESYRKSKMTLAAGNKSKSYTHPWEDRTVLSDVYEGPLSERESWWRNEIKVTPSPGTYEITDFLTELSKKPNSYRFKSVSRKNNFAFMRSGALLLPGNYEVHDFIEDLNKKQATYSFKSEQRDAKDVLNFGLKDKNINVPPNAYHVETFLSVDGEKAPVKSYMFKSQSKRFPNNIFRPKEGPAPGAYDVKDTAPPAPAVTSCFRSKQPRFPMLQSVYN